MKDNTKRKVKGNIKLREVRYLKEGRRSERGIERLKKEE